MPNKKSVSVAEWAKGEPGKKWSDRNEKSNRDPWGTGVSQKRIVAGVARVTVKRPRDGKPRTKAGRF